jgi:branched-chain amino acid transport system substrate-binding protein
VADRIFAWQVPESLRRHLIFDVNRGRAIQCRARCWGRHRINVQRCRRLDTGTGPLLYCLTARVHPPAGSFVYSTGFSSLNQIGAAVRYFRERGWHKVAQLTTNDATGQDADRTIDSVFSPTENHSEAIVAREHFSIGDISLAAQVARIRSVNTEAVIAWVTGSPLGTVLHAFRDAGIDLPLVSTSGNASYTEPNTFKSLLPSQMLFASQIVLVPAAAPKPSRDPIAKFYARYKAMNIRPDTGYRTTWDMAMIVVAALRKYGGSPTSVQLRDYLENVRDWNGFSAGLIFTYPQRGLAPGSIPMIRWNAARDNLSSFEKEAIRTLGRDLLDSLSDGMHVLVETAKAH